MIYIWLNMFNQNFYFMKKIKNWIKLLRDLPDIMYAVVNIVNEIRGMIQEFRDKENKDVPPNQSKNG